MLASDVGDSRYHIRPHPHSATRTQLGSDIPAHVNMPAVHLAASQLKRWIDGTLHQGISREQMAYYLDEFTFRFNRRTSTSRGLLYRLLQQCTNTNPAPLKSLFSSAYAK